MEEEIESRLHKNKRCVVWWAYNQKTKRQLLSLGILVVDPAQTFGRLLQTFESVDTAKTEGGVLGKSLVVGISLTNELSIDGGFVLVVSLVVASDGFSEQEDASRFKPSFHLGKELGDLLVIEVHHQPGPKDNIEGVIRKVESTGVTSTELHDLTVGLGLELLAATVDKLRNEVLSHNGASRLHEDLCESASATCELKDISQTAVASRGESREVTKDLLNVLACTVGLEAVVEACEGIRVKSFSLPAVQ